MTSLADNTIGAPRRVSAYTSSSAFIGRSMRHSLRDVEGLVMATVLPVVLMLLFTYVFGGAIFSDGSYLAYVVPGVIILCATQGSASVGGAVARDLAEGVMNRFRTLPIVSSTVLVGHIVASCVRNLVASLLVVGVAVIIGFRPATDIGSVLGALIVITCFAFTITVVMATIGLLSSSQEAVTGYAFLLFVLPYVSSGFAPVSTMPSWLQGFAAHQPFTPIIEALRGFLSGTPDWGSVGVAAIWCAGAVAVCAAVATAVFPRRITTSV